MPQQQTTRAHPLIDGCPPVWASAWGQDQYGIWVAFNYGEAEQRLRWIPPGHFVMGSPNSEAGRFHDELPHRVTLTQGFWLFDTPVTQALWSAVMGKNPSQFQSPQRPVEQVSWNDCQAFIEKINHHIPGLALRLPTEAEWEFACRAGTTTATYAGDLDIKDENNAPVLDAIAWYGGNSGVNFELKNGVDSSGWPGKQHAHKKASTHPVAQKVPNAWGLYDMLGNVWEWCGDWYGAYSGKEEIDPIGPKEGAIRVSRGGGWNGLARCQPLQLAPRRRQRRSRLPLCPRSGDGRLRQSGGKPAPAERAGIEL
ncbi:MAG: formylglycine-generating enzyme family protein [bacterium]